MCFYVISNRKKKKHPPWTKTNNAARFWIHMDICGGWATLSGAKLSCLQMRVVTAAAQHIFREASAIWLGQSPPCCNTLLQGDCLLKFPMQCGYHFCLCPLFFSSISTCSWWFCILGDISPLLLYFKNKKGSWGDIVVTPNWLKKWWTNLLGCW